MLVIFIKQLKLTKQMHVHIHMHDLPYLPFYITVPMHQCMFIVFNKIQALIIHLIYTKHVNLLTLGLKHVEKRQYKG